MKDTNSRYILAPICWANVNPLYPFVAISVNAFHTAIGVGNKLVSTISSFVTIYHAANIMTTVAIVTFFSTGNFFFFIVLPRFTFVFNVSALLVSICTTLSISYLIGFKDRHYKDLSISRCSCMICFHDHFYDLICLIIGCDQCDQSLG